jgi:hypothetical protein
MIPHFRPPAEILDELGITEPSEIVIEAIAEYCGATIVYEPLEGSEARILGAGDRAIVTVNSTSPRPRQRFSAAHELGHWMRDRGKVAFSCTDRNLVQEWDEDNPERRANRYAADLLLPRRFIERLAHGLPPTFASARSLGETFTTSLMATAIRLVEFGAHPAMIVCTQPAGREWFFRSPLVPAELWPRRKPGAGALATRLLGGNPSVPCEPTTVDADEWIDHSEASKYTVVEDSRRMGEDLVLTLLWWKDEAQILALRDDDEEEEEPGLTGQLTFGSRRRRR